MGWHFVSGGMVFSYLQDKKTGKTTTVHTCESCGFVGKLDTVHYRLWMPLLFIPVIPLSNYDRAVCPKCNTSQEIIDKQGKIEE
jgi:hypothetical protein